MIKIKKSLSRKEKSYLNFTFSIVYQIINFIYGIIIPRLIILHYGSEMNGVATSITQFLSYFSLVTAGLAQAGAYALYGPLAEKNKDKINKVLAIIGYEYYRSGLIVSGLCVFFAFLYPYFVKVQCLSHSELVLLIIDILQRGGAEMHALTVIKGLNKSIFDIYILRNGNKIGPYDDILKENSCKIIRHPNFGNLTKTYFKRKKYFVDLFKEHNFDVVHLHCNSQQTFVFFKFAKIAKIKKIIVHSHVSKKVKGLKNNIFNFIIKNTWINNSNIRLACSSLAGKYLYDNKKYIYVQNSIDLVNFKYNIQNREKIRKELDIDANIIIGHIGRIEWNKNQIFTIEILKGLVNKEKGFDIESLIKKMEEIYSK